MVYTRTTSGTIFSSDVWISGGQGDFSLQTWCIPLEAFASNKIDTCMQVNRTTCCLQGKSEIPRSLKFLELFSNLKLFIYAQVNELLLYNTQAILLNSSIIIDQPRY